MAETLTRSKEPPFLSLVEFKRAALYQPCEYHGKENGLTNIEITRHRGAHHFRPMPVCLICAVEMKHHFLNQGTIVQVERGALAPRIGGR